MPPAHLLCPDPLPSPCSVRTARLDNRQVYYFKYIRDDCLSAIAVNLRASVYAPQELITGNELHIVMRGVAGQQGRIITRGNVWGEVRPLAWLLCCCALVPCALCLVPCLLAACCRSHLSLT